MTEKVKLTREQAASIKLAVADYGSNTVLDMHAENPYWITKLSSLNTLSPNELARALYIGYEIEEEYKVGDWVRIVSDVHQTKNETRKVTEIKKSHAAREDVHYKLDGRGVYFKSYIRHATPEEIKAEQERRQWAKISREVGEFRDGDVGVMNNIMVTRITDIEMIKECYEQKCLLGIYPVESFIEFGGEADA